MNVPAAASFPSLVKQTLVIRSGSSVQICHGNVSAPRYAKEEKVAYMDSLFRYLESKAKSAAITSIMSSRQRTFQSLNLQSNDPDKKKRSSFGWKEIEVTKSRCYKVHKSETCREREGTETYLESTQAMRFRNVPKPDCLIHRAR